MHKWLWLGLIVASVMWLGGCGGSDNTLQVGEGDGEIVADDFTPGGTAGGPMDLMTFVIPSTGVYQVILSSGSGDPSLPNPFIRVLAGNVTDDPETFFGAYNGGAGVLDQNHGAGIAVLNFTADGGDEFTFLFSSYNNGGVGSYRWRVVQQ